MALRTLLMTGLAVLTLTGAAPAQTTAEGRALLTITEVLHLDAIEVVSAGSEGEAVRLSVIANRRWALEVVLEGPEGGAWSAGAVATGRPGRVPVELLYRDLLEAAGAPEGARPRFTLSAL